MSENSEQPRKLLTKQLEYSKTALLIIDMQNDFVSDQGYLGLKGQKLGMVRETIPAMKNVLDHFRENRLTVIYTQTLHYRYTNTENWISRTAQKSLDPSICIPGTWGAEIIEELKPVNGEPVIVKHRYDSFLDTDLHLVLRAAGIENLVIVGTQTNLCVDTTARSAYMRDYTTIILEDCVSTPELEFHKTMLDNFRKNFGYVERSRDLLNRL